MELKVRSLGKEAVVGWLGCGFGVAPHWKAGCAWVGSGAGWKLWVQTGRDRTLRGKLRQGSGMDAQNLKEFTCAVRDNKCQRAGACKWLWGRRRPNGLLGLKRMDWRELCALLRVSAKGIYYLASNIYPERIRTVSKR